MSHCGMTVAPMPTHEANGVMRFFLTLQLHNATGEFVRSVNFDGFPSRAKAEQFGRDWWAEWQKSDTIVLT